MTRISPEAASDPDHASDLTRDRLIVAAAARFAEHGVDRVSLEEVANDAGVHRTTLHRHFPGGREELILAVLAHEVRVVVSTLEGVIAAAVDATDALTSALVMAVEEGRANRTIAALVTQSAPRQSIFGPAAGELREHAERAWRLILERSPERSPARAAGQPPERVVDHLFRVITSLIAEPGMVAGPDAVRDYVAAFVVPALVA